MEKFGYLDQLNGMDQLPFWDNEPCTNISASEGSFFPPREYTKSDMRYVYDKDLCRIIPLEFRSAVYKDGKFDKTDCLNFFFFTHGEMAIQMSKLHCFTGIPADLYSTPENIYGDSENNSNNSCFDTEDYKSPRGLQNISPCQYSKCLHNI